jgi:hypothetical protein
MMVARRVSALACQLAYMTRRGGYGKNIEKKLTAIIIRASVDVFASCTERCEAYDKVAILLHIAAIVLRPQLSVDIVRVTNAFIAASLHYIKCHIHDWSRYDSDLGSIVPSSL